MQPRLVFTFLPLPPNENHSFLILPKRGLCSGFFCSMHRMRPCSGVPGEMAAQPSSSLTICHALNGPLMVCRSLVRFLWKRCLFLTLACRHPDILQMGFHSPHAVGWLSCHPGVRGFRWEASSRASGPRVAGGSAVLKLHFKMLSLGSCNS